MITSYYFKESEFQQCTPACSLQDMQQSMMNCLDHLRAQCGFPFKINSAYRRRTYEIEKGRSGSSSHTKGLAVDIHCIDEAKRMKIIKYALDMGISRVGISRTYIHLDIDGTKKQSIIWVY